jgi:hypothetical protein
MSKVSADPGCNVPWLQTAGAKMAGCTARQLVTLAEPSGGFLLVAMALLVSR